MDRETEIEMRIYIIVYTLLPLMQVSRDQYYGYVYISICISIYIYILR